MECKNPHIEKNLKTPNKGKLNSLTSLNQEVFLVYAALLLDNKQIFPPSPLLSPWVLVVVSLTF